MMPAVVAWLRADLRRFDLVVAALTVGLSTLLILALPTDYDIGWPEVPAGVGAFVLVVMRRRWPLALWCVAIVSAVVFVTLWGRPTTLVFASLVLLATACLRLERLPAVALGLVSAVVVYLIALVGFLPEGTSLGDTDAVIGIVWSALAVGVADAVRSWRRSTEAAEAQRQLELLASEAQVREQVSEERLSIARELHDLLAHNLSVMNVQTGAALHLLRSDPDQAETSLITARDAGRSILDELRDLLSVLRHEGSDAPQSSLPSFDELPELVDTMRASGLDVQWAASGEELVLAPAVSLAAYRIVQEALTNAAKHGDHTVSLATEWEHDGISVRVSNRLGASTKSSSDGVPGHGLVGMRERAIGNGGRFATNNENGRFVIDAWLPATRVGEIKQ